MCNIFLSPEPSSSSTDDALLLSTAERTTGAIYDETLIIPAAAAAAEVSNLLQPSWLCAGGEVQPDWHVPIGIASTPPNVKLQHYTAKRLAGLRFMRKLRRQELNTQMMTTACSSTN